MQVRARRFVCNATFTNCISGCFQYSAILIEVRAKQFLLNSRQARTETVMNAKSPLQLNSNRKFVLEKQ